MTLTNGLDASAAVRLILGDPAAAGLAQQIGEAALVLAPELMLTEVANTLWKLRRADQLIISTLSNCWPMPTSWLIGWSRIATCRPRPWLWLCT